MAAPLVHGKDLQNEGKYPKQCERCKASLLMARVAGSNGLRWCAFELPAITQDDGTLQFKVHWCPIPLQQTQPQRRPQSAEPPRRQRRLF